MQKWHKRIIRLKLEN